MKPVVEYLTEAKRKQIYKKYIVRDNTFQPVGEVVTIKEVPAGIYKIGRNMQGLYFEQHDLNTDKILRFEDSRYNEILREIDKFWGLKENYKNMGFTHKRGILLYGVPGSGKSCLLKIAMEDSVKNDNIVLIAKSGSMLAEGLTQIKDIEKKRKVLAIIEDIDEIVRYNEHSILELFDGENQMDNILFLATTNYINRLPARILRASRFDRKIEIENPPYNGRYAYLENKLKGQKNEMELKVLAEKTNGFSFGQLREFIVAAYCLKQNEDQVISRLRANLETSLIEGFNFKKYKDTICESKNLSDIIYNAFSKEIGPSSSGRLTDKMMKLKTIDRKNVEKIISSEWGPNITKRIIQHLKDSGVLK